MMATLQQLIDNFLGTSVTTNLSEEVRKGLSQGTPLTDLAGASKTPRTSSPTGSRAIDRMPVSGEMRQASELRRGPQPRPQGGSMPLKTVPLTLEQMAQRRAQNPGTPAMSEFAGADMPLPFGRFGQVTEPAQSEFVNATSPMPTPGDLPGSDENEELFADNIALSLLQDLPANPAARAANQAKADAAKGLAFGTQLAKAQNQEGLISQAADTISGLLGNVDFKGLFRVLARPEFVAPMGPGQSPLTNFVNAAAADRTAQATARAAQQAAGLEGFKAETDRLKALMPDPSKLPKLNSQVVDLTTGIQANKTLIELGNKIKTSLTANIASTGGPGEVAKAVEAIGAAIGFSPEKGAGSSAQEIDEYIARMRIHVIGTGIFGREANKQELALLDSILPKSGFFKSRESIRRNIDAAMKSAENLMAIKNNLLVQSGYKSFEEMAKQPVAFRRGM
jgi:hypothetical protein